MRMDRLKLGNPSARFESLTGRQGRLQTTTNLQAVAATASGKAALLSGIDPMRDERLVCRVHKKPGAVFPAGRNNGVCISQLHQLADSVK
jgi:hypothetical protein